MPSLVIMEGPLRSGRLRTGPALAEQTFLRQLGSTITNSVESPASRRGSLADGSAVADGPTELQRTKHWSPRSTPTD